MTVNVYDTPGFDAHNSSIWFNEILDNVNKSSYNIAAFAIVMNHGDTRFNNENNELLQILQKGLGDDFWKHVVVIISKFNTARASLPSKNYIRHKFHYFKEIYNVIEQPSVFYIDSFHNSKNFQEAIAFKDVLDRLISTLVLLNKKPYSIHSAVHVDSTTMWSTVLEFWQTYATHENAMYLGIAMGVMIGIAVTSSMIFWFCGCHALTWRYKKKIFL